MASHRASVYTSREDSKPVRLGSAQTNGESSHHYFCTREDASSGEIELFRGRLSLVGERKIGMDKYCARQRRWGAWRDVSS